MMLYSLYVGALLVINVTCKEIRPLFSLRFQQVTDSPNIITLTDGHNITCLSSSF